MILDDMVQERFDTFGMTPRAIATLLPYIEQAAENEFDSDRVRHEFENFANELRARLQRIAADRGVNPEYRL